MGLHFRRQNVIRGFIVDFYCHRARLVVEIDGDIQKTRVEIDVRRDVILKSMGLTVLRLSNEILQTDLENALCAIREGCLQGISDLRSDDIFHTDECM